MKEFYTLVEGHKAANNVAVIYHRMFIISGLFWCSKLSTYQLEINTEKCCPCLVTSAISIAWPHMKLKGNKDSFYIGS